LFEIPEERFDQLGPLSIEAGLGDAEIGERIADEMSHWLAQPANAKYLEKSARPVAVLWIALLLRSTTLPIPMNYHARRLHWIHLSRHATASERWREHRRSPVVTPESLGMLSRSRIIRLILKSCFF
jgi:hypothetical protein